MFVALGLIKLFMFFELLTPRLQNLFTHSHYSQSPSIYEPADAAAAAQPKHVPVQSIINAQNDGIFLSKSYHYTDLGLGCQYVVIWLYLCRVIPQLYLEIRSKHIK